MDPLGVKILDLSVNEGVEEDIEMTGVHANCVMWNGHIWKLNEGDMEIKVPVGVNCGIDDCLKLEIKLDSYFFRSSGVWALDCKDTSCDITLSYFDSILGVDSQEISWISKHFNIDLSLNCLAIELFNFWEKLQDLIGCIFILQIQREDLLVNGHKERSQHGLMKENLIAVESWNSLCLEVIGLNMIGAMNGIIECSIKVECD